MKASDLTIAIATRARPYKLERCLKSVVNQTILPRQVLIVDNDPKHTAERVAIKFKNKLPIRYETEEIPGVPSARNKALNLCRTGFIGFLDDDCVLDKHWVAKGTMAINKAKATYILGRTLLLNRHSLIAQAQYVRQKRWFFYKFKGNIPGPFALDTKNVIISNKTLRKEQILFDDKMLPGGYDSSDTDLSLQLYTKDKRGLYEENMVVYHEETPNLFNFIKKAYYRGRYAYLINKKWNLTGEFVDKSQINLLTYLSKLRLWPREFTKYQKVIKNTFLREIVIFVIIKIYERIHLQGFFYQKKLQSGVKNS